MKTEVSFFEGRVYKPSPNTLHLWLFDEEPAHLFSHLPNFLAEIHPKSGKSVFQLSESFVWFCQAPADHALIGFREELASLIRNLPDWTQKVHVYLHSSNQLYKAAIEAILLAQYTFSGYRKKTKDKATLSLSIFSPSDELPQITQEQIQLCKSVMFARNLINEPYPILNSISLAEAAEKMAEELGLRCEVFNHARITSLKMGGILAVNQGSEIPPTFSVIEYTPAGTENNPPVILVGKGVVYDSGGLSLKPTPGSMDYMKSDMAGAAAVLGSIQAAALNQLPVRIVGIIPSSDNMPGPKSYVPGEVITMFDGTTVEVMNTDAEGRLLLADALAYAAKYKPALVIDFATLTGAAMRAIGQNGAVAMGTAGEKTFNLLKLASEQSGERWVEFPLWEDYADEIKSEIADLKNLGGENAGAITAGKFLQHFTNYPWIHFDIAGPAYLHKTKGLFSYGGTGYGVRLSYEFLKLYSTQS